VNSLAKSTLAKNSLVKTSLATSPFVNNPLDNEMLDDPAFNWDYGRPQFVHEKVVTQEHIDVMGHTNNVVYMQWLENIAWAHSQSLGLDWAAYEKLNRAMVARRHEIDYLAATHLGDEMVLGTWITSNDEKLCITRAYQLVRTRDYATIVRGQTHWVCTAVDSGRPKRMPQDFVDGYVPVKASE